jgi:hypothetical protein
MVYSSRGECQYDHAPLWDWGARENAPVPQFFLPERHRRARVRAPRSRLPLPLSDTLHPQHTLAMSTVVPASSADTVPSKNIPPPSSPVANRADVECRVFARSAATGAFGAGSVRMTIVGCATGIGGGVAGTFVAIGSGGGNSSASPPSPPSSPSQGFVVLPGSTWASVSITDSDDGGAVEITLASAIPSPAGLAVPSDSDQEPLLVDCIRLLPVLPTSGERLADLWRRIVGGSADETASSLSPSPAPPPAAPAPAAPALLPFPPHLNEGKPSLKRALKLQVLHDPDFVALVDGLCDIVLHAGATREERSGSSRSQFRRQLLTAMWEQLQVGAAAAAAAAAASSTAEAGGSATGGAPPAADVAAAAATVDPEAAEEEEEDVSAARAAPPPPPAALSPQSRFPRGVASSSPLAAAAAAASSWPSMHAPITPADIASALQLERPAGAGAGSSSASVVGGTSVSSAAASRPGGRRRHGGSGLWPAHLVPGPDAPPAAAAAAPSAAYAHSQLHGSQQQVHRGGAARPQHLQPHIRGGSHHSRNLEMQHGQLQVSASTHYYFVGGYDDQRPPFVQLQHHHQQQQTFQPQPEPFQQQQYQPQQTFQPQQEPVQLQQPFQPHQQHQQHQQQHQQLPFHPQVLQVQQPYAHHYSPLHAHAPENGNGSGSGSAPVYYAGGAHTASADGPSPYAASPYAAYAVSSVAGASASSPSPAPQQHFVQQNAYYAHQQAGVHQHHYTAPQAMYAYTTAPDGSYVAVPLSSAVHMGSGGGPLSPE